MGFMEQFRPRQQSQLAERVNAVKGMAKGDPSALMRSLMQTNPRFAQFVAQNQGKTPEEAFREHGLDYSQVKRLL